MDFSYLLELAKNNDKSNKQEASVSRFSTKVSKSKKIDKPGVKITAVHAVLQKMETDKQKETEEAMKKKQNLLALRAQDRKSNKRIKAMINMSKGASKAVLEDTKDLTTAKGEEQCDEDDYGYESAMSQNIFKKLADQYASNPDDDKLKFIKNSSRGVKDIADIKSRVMNSLKKEEEEEQGPRKRKRKRKNSGEFDAFINDGDSYDNSTPGTSETKSATPTTPKEKIVNVNLTNYKSDKHNNFKYDKEHRKGKNKRSEREEGRDKRSEREEGRDKRSEREEGRDKRSEREEGRDKRSEREEGRDKRSEREEGRDKRSEREEGRDKRSEREEEKVKKHKPKPKAKAGPPPMSFEELLRVAQKKQVEDPIPNIRDEKIKEKEKKKEIDRPLTAKEKEEQEDERRRKLKRLGKLPPEKKESVKEDSKTAPGAVDKQTKNGESKQKPIGNNKLRQQLESPKSEPKVIDRSKYFAVPFAQKSNNPPQAKEPKPQPSKPPQPKLQANTKQEVSKLTKPQRPKEMPQKDIRPEKSQKFPQKERGRPFPPPDMRRKPPVNLPPGKRRIESDSEEEYDSEMDDFIDDGDEELDYRSEISKMFGYDRNKYQDENDDLSDMEASYTQMQKEERVSAKIGLREDLEDIKREEEEKKCKMMKLKQMRKGKR